MKRLGVVAVLKGLDTGVHDANLVKVSVRLEGSIVHCHDPPSPCLHKDLKNVMWRTVRR